MIKFFNHNFIFGGRFMYCRRCGAEIKDDAVICPKCCTSTGKTEKTTETYKEKTSVPYKRDRPSDALGFLGFLIPVVGLILYLVWKDDYPKKAHSVGAGALTGVIVGVCLAILLPIFGISCIGCMATRTYY